MDIGLLGSIGPGSKSPFTGNETKQCDCIPTPKENSLPATITTRSLTEAVQSISVPIGDANIGIHANIASHPPDNTSRPTTKHNQDYVDKETRVGDVIADDS